MVTISPPRSRATGGVLRRRCTKRCAGARLAVLVAAAVTARAGAAELDRPAAVEDATPAEPRGALRLREALHLALARSPDLQAFSWEIRARDARALQAGRPPNPELRTEVEDIGGSGDRKGFEETETTIRLSQLVELGGKRAARRRVADLGTALATWDYEARRLQVLADTARAFILALAAQERVALAGEMARLAARAVAAVDAQVEAGAAPPVAASRARVAHGRAELERRRAEQERDAARVVLAASWGSTRPVFAGVAGDLTRLGAPPAPEALLARLERHPDLARWETEVEERQAAVVLGRAGRVPDVTVGAGGRHFSDNGDTALVFELSVPLPVFDRNQGAIAEADHRLAKARVERTAARVTARAALETAAARLAAAYERATILRDGLLPRAQAAVDDALEAFRRGGFGVVDVLDAQRTLFELRSDHLASLESYHLALAEVDRLTAAPLADGVDGGTP